jgi:hypothetical protein
LGAVSDVLRAWAGGLNISMTDMGRILAGEIMTKEDFEGRNRWLDESPKLFELKER